MLFQARRTKDGFVIGAEAACWCDRENRYLMLCRYRQTELTPILSRSSASRGNSWIMGAAVIY